MTTSPKPAERGARAGSASERVRAAAAHGRLTTPRGSSVRKEVTALLSGQLVNRSCRRGDVKPRRALHAQSGHQGGRGQTRGHLSRADRERDMYPWVSLHLIGGENGAGRCVHLTRGGHPKATSGACSGDAGAPAPGHSHGDFPEVWDPPWSLHSSNLFPRQHPSRYLSMAE